MNTKLRRLPDWIEDIRGAIGNIREDIKGLTKSRFLEDGKSQRAVAKSVADIGEAARRIMELAPDLAQRSPDIWKHFVGVYRSRNILVHAYFLIDAAIVWDTIENYIPQLEALLDTVVFDNDSGENGSAGDMAGSAPSNQ